MSALRISLLGGVHIAHTAYAAESKVTRSVQALLAYLLLQGHRSHSRDALAGLFWGEHREDQARSCLSTALWRLRTILEPSGVPRGTYLVVTPMGEVCFNWASDYWLDVAVFEELVGQVRVQPTNPLTGIKVQELQNALHLYTGELLEGFYADWVLRERERLRTLYLHSLQRLMEYYQQQRMYAESLAYGQLILQHDPLREDIHRALMRLHGEHGQRVLAARQYEACRDLLAAELDISPLEETQTLYAQIILLDGSRPAPGANGESMSLQQARHQLRLAMRCLNGACEHLQQAIQLVEGVAKDR